MFPRGLPGLALVLLRVSVALTLLFECYAHRQTLPGWGEAAAVTLSLALCLGYLTPVVALAAVVFCALVWASLGAASGTMAAIGTLDAIALALLGPGAYSIDSRRYGRRIVVLSPP